MNIILGVVIGLAIGIAAMQLGAIVIGPLVDIALSIVAAVLLVAAIAAASLYVLREPFFRKLRLKVDAKVEDLRQPATAVVEALDRRDSASAVSASIELGTVILAWQSQIRARQAILAGISALLAVLAAILGSSLLVRQNELLKGQTDLMREQTEVITQQANSNRVQALADIVNSMGIEQGTSSDVQIALLTTFGEKGFDVLIGLSRSDTPQGEKARDTLTQHRKAITSQQAALTIRNMLESYTGTLGRACDRYSDCRALLSEEMNRWLDTRGAPSISGASSQLFGMLHMFKVALHEASNLQQVMEAHGFLTQLSVNLASYEVEKDKHAEAFAVVRALPDTHEIFSRLDEIWAALDANVKSFDDVPGLTDSIGDHRSRMKSYFITLCTFKDRLRKDPMPNLGEDRPSTSKPKPEHQSSLAERC